MKGECPSCKIKCRQDFRNSDVSSLKNNRMNDVVNVQKLRYKTSVYYCVIKIIQKPGLNFGVNTADEKET